MRRPATVTWLALAVLILSAVCLLRAARVFLDSAYLAQLSLSVSPVYLGVSGLGCGAALGAAAIGLWRLRPWGRWLALGGVSLYHLLAWINRVVFDASTYSRQVWPWAAAATVLGVGLTWGVLFWPGIRAVFEAKRSKG